MPHAARRLRRGGANDQPSVARKKRGDRNPSRGLIRSWGMTIEAIVRSSEPLKFEDLAWDVAKTAGLTAEETTILDYFADVEGQTVFYLQEMLHTNVTASAEGLTFLTLWNYEEFFHGYALTHVLATCGTRRDMARKVAIRKKNALRIWLEDKTQRVLAALAPSAFFTLYATWGASQEYLTLHGYERLAATTKNPVLKELCERIAKQERRHFAWYYKTAAEGLAKSSLARKLVRFILTKAWTPVGVGVKTEAEAKELVSLLFPGDVANKTFAAIDQKLSKLPGLEGTNVTQSYWQRAR